MLSAVEKCAPAGSGRGPYMRNPQHPTASSGALSHNQQPPHQQPLPQQQPSLQQQQQHPLHPMMPPGALLSQVPLPPLPHAMSSVASEFARPFPKPQRFEENRGFGIPSALTTECRLKYGDPPPVPISQKYTATLPAPQQTGPVNLAFNSGAIGEEVVSGSSSAAAMFGGNRRMRSSSSEDPRVSSSGAGGISKLKSSSSFGGGTGGYLDGDASRHQLSCAGLVPGVGKDKSLSGNERNDGGHQQLQFYSTPASASHHRMSFFPPSLDVLGAAGGGYPPSFNYDLFQYSRMLGRPTYLPNQTPAELVPYMQPHLPKSSVDGAGGNISSNGMSPSTSSVESMVSTYNAALHLPLHPLYQQAPNHPLLLPAHHIHQVHNHLPAAREPTRGGGFLDLGIEQHPVSASSGSRQRSSSSSVSSCDSLPSQARPSVPQGKAGSSNSRQVFKEPTTTTGTGTSTKATGGGSGSSSKRRSRRRSVASSSSASRSQEVAGPGSRQVTMANVVVSSSASTSPPQPCNSSCVLSLSAEMKDTLVHKAFVRGSMISFLEGMKKRVEDVRMDDFIHTASMTPGIRIAEAQACRITPRYYHPTGTFPQKVMVRFTYEDRPGALEANIDHPFFVKAKGWASLHPERTYSTYGLSCNLFEVGDVFIAIIPPPHAENNEQSVMMDQQSCSSSFPSQPATPSVQSATSEEVVEQRNQDVEDGEIASHNRKKKIEGVVADCSNQNSKKYGDIASPNQSSSSSTASSSSSPPLISDGSGGGDDGDRPPKRNSNGCENNQPVCNRNRGRNEIPRLTGWLAANYVHDSEASDQAAREACVYRNALVCSKRRKERYRHEMTVKRQRGEEVDERTPTSNVFILNCDGSMYEVNDSESE